MDSLNSAREIFNVLNLKKCENVICLDVKKISSICDYFIICDANSTTAVKSIAEFVCDELDEKIPVIRKDGVKEGQWAILDFGDVIVHIFLVELRNFYNLEKLFDLKNKVELK